MSHECKLSKVNCENCLETGCLKLSKNLYTPKSSDPVIGTICTKCSNSRVYKIINPIRKNGKIIDYVVDIRPVTKFASTAPLPSGKKQTKKDVKEVVENLKGAQDMKKTVVNQGTPQIDSRKMQEGVLSTASTYFDVLSYKLDDDGCPSEDPAIEGSDWVDERDGHKRWPDNTESAAPKGRTIAPKDEKLEYRNYSKPLTTTSQLEKGKIKVDENTYIPIGVFVEASKEGMSNNVKKSLLQTSLDEDYSSFVKESGKTQAVYMQPGGCQWCPKARRAVPFFVCSEYCIDGRRVPQTEKEFETFSDYLIKGGHDDGFVFCGYKDWLKREVDAYYPGWLEDHIKKMGGEVPKNVTPFQHKMNLDPGQRRQMPQYPDMKTIEKRLENNHVYNDQRNIALAKLNEWQTKVAEIENSLKNGTASSKQKALSELNSLKDELLTDEKKDIFNNAVISNNLKKKHIVN